MAVLQLTIPNQKIYVLADSTVNPDGFREVSVYFGSVSQPAGSYEYRIGQVDIGMWDGTNNYSQIFFHSFSCYGPKVIRTGRVNFGAPYSYALLRLWPDEKIIGDEFVIAVNPI